LPPAPHREIDLTFVSELLPVFSTGDVKVGLFPGDV